MTAAARDAQPHAMLFGHPVGLFTLFFAEMWERFSYYGMRALLIFYMMKGFLGYNDTKAYAIYGAYTALVYMTPYFGGMIADRILGPRRAVILGGLFMAAGHAVMAIENNVAFFAALALLIVGNGFFKPNISTIVGGLYPKGSTKKDGGFTIFYMGINLGAAMSPVVCGYVGETFGWHYGFNLATVGMLIGVAVFAAPTRVTQLLIGLGALGTSIAMLTLWDSGLQLVIRILLAAALVAAGGAAVVALNRGGLPKEVGDAKDPEALKKYGMMVYGGSLLSVVVVGLVFFEVSIAGVVLTITGILALAYIINEARKADLFARHRLYVVLILMFFSLLFWAFFEQAGSSMNNFADRNIDRAYETGEVGQDKVGSTLSFRVHPGASEPEVAALPLLSQEQLGHMNGDPVMKDRIAAAIREVEAGKAEKKGEELDVESVDKLIAQAKEEPRLTMTGLTALRDVAGKDGAPADTQTVEWKVVEENVGMKLTDSEIPASEFQAANPIFILLFGLVFSGLWGFMSARNIEPSTPVKFSLGLLQLGLGFAALWWGAQNADTRGMVGLSWLLIAYLLHTTGELCLSPVGLSMVTKLSPSHMVSTVMGAWFLATAFSNYLASIIATFTGVGHGDSDEVMLTPPPIDTVDTYGSVFGQIAVVACISALICFAISPLLKKWMHEDQLEHDDDGTDGGAKPQASEPETSKT